MSLIYKVLKGSAKSVADEKMRYSINYPLLQSLESIVESAKKLQEALFAKEKKVKQADWLIKMAKKSDIEIDDALRKEVALVNEREAPADGKKRNQKSLRQEDWKISDLKEKFAN